MTSQRPLFDPKLDSRGIWHIYKIKAIGATTEESKKDFWNELTWLSLNFPCKKCRKHMQKYLQNEPFELYENVTVGDNDVGCFKYIWGLQNSVNLKLSKPLIPFDVAYSLYNPNNITQCAVGCEDSDEDEAEEKKIQTKGSTVTQTASVTPIRFLPSARK